MLALVQPSEFWFLPPICLAIALVTSAAHRENMREILRHAMRSWIVLMIGLAVFAAVTSLTVGLLLP